MERDLCQLCHKQDSKYTCPRCHLRYCSVDCYKSQDHLQCSETFYRECFMEGLKDFNNSDEDREKMKDMLRRLEEENPEVDSDDSADDDEPDLEERLAGLDLDADADKIWSRLSGRERQEFEKMLKDGRLGNMLKLWEPWWKNKDPRKVAEVGPPVAPPTTPQLVHVEDLATLLKHGSPSPNIPYSIINVLYGYAYVTRLHNGSHCDTPRHVVREVSCISEALASGSFPGTSDALHGCLASLHQQAKSSYVSQDFSVAVLLDVKGIVEGPHQMSPLVYSMAALSDLHRMVRAAKKQVNKELLKQAESSARWKLLQEEKKRLFCMRKKLEFFLSWMEKFGSQLLALTVDIDLEFCTLSTELVSHMENQEKLEIAWGGKRPPRKPHFIEEINST